MLNLDYLKQLEGFYKNELLSNILPFWIKYSRDSKAGGYHTCLDRAGTVYDYDKLCMWHAGRIIWTYSFLYNELEKNEEWIQMAEWGMDFVEKYGFGPEGNMYYALTRDGKPLMPARDVYTELSTVLGYTEYARANGDDAIYNKARDIFMRVWKALQKPGQAFQPFDPRVRPVRLHGHSMITLNVIQELRRYRGEPEYETMIDRCLEIMIDMHLKPEKKSLLELVSWNGDEIPGSNGRWLNPGHMIEGGTFVIHEGQRRRDEAMIRTGVNLIDWGFQWGWDKEYGGIHNDVDIDGLPVPASEALVYDSKLWWQHAEALYGLLLAYCVTGENKYLNSYRLVHDYSMKNFSDIEYGEWFAVLDRRGNKVGQAKGTARKSSFHIARNFYLCYKLISQL